MRVKQLLKSERVLLMKNSESGFGIIESLVVLAIILTVTASLNQYFTSSRDEVVYRKAKLGFEEDILRLFMVTEENSVCEHLDFVRNGVYKLDSGATEGPELELPEIKIDGVSVIKVDSPADQQKKRYAVSKVTVKQISKRYAQYPSRARGEIIIYATISKGKNKPRLNVKQNIELILAGNSANSTTVTSCYGTFSRDIACADRGKHYDPNRKPSCQ